MKSREEQLTWAKQRALICVDMGGFSDAVAGLRADLAENPLTKGAMSSDRARRGYKAAIDAALGRGSKALTEWIEGFRLSTGAQMGVGYRRARLSALAGGGAFGYRFGFVAASNLASAARSGSKRGAWGNLSSAMTPRIAAVTAASSSAGRSIVGTARI